MFIKGIYTPAEQRMLDDFSRQAQSMSGWAGETKRLGIPVNYTRADAAMFKIIAKNNDPKNPLYLDERYAEQSCWGKRLAPPMFLLDASQQSYLRLTIPEDVGVCLSCHSGAEYEWFEPVLDGDRIRVFCEKPVLVDETPTDSSDTRVLAVYYTNRFYKQGQCCVGRITHSEKWVYAAPGTERPEILSAGYEKLPASCRLVRNIRMTEDFVYTAQQAAAIQELYETEFRHGDAPFPGKDIQVGQELPLCIHGPITEWDAVGAVGPSSEKTLTMMEIRRRHPDIIRFDEHGIPHHPDEIYLSKTVPACMDMYSSSVPEQTLAGQLLRLVNNWMGDDAFIRRFSWQRMTNTALGDTIFCRGRVTGKHIDQDGDTLVSVRLCAENVRGFVTAFGRAEICFPEAGGVPECMECVPVAVGAGDRVIIHERADWPLAGGFPLAGKSGQIVETSVDDPDYVYVLLDGGCPGMDARVALGFAASDLVKE